MEKSPKYSRIAALCLLSAIPFFFVDESFPKLMILTISGVVIGEFSEWVRLFLVKSIKNPIAAIESSCVRFNDSHKSSFTIVEDLENN